MVNLESNIRLDKSDNLHNYLDENNNIIKLPSVTELVGFIYPFNKDEIDQVILAKAILRGNHIHQKMETFIKTRIITPCCQVESHKKLFLKTKRMWLKLVDTLEIEEVYSEFGRKNDMFVGTMDVLARTKKNKWIIIDFKTTTLKDEIQIKKEALQLFLYSILVKDLGIKIDKWYVINASTKNYAYLLSDKENKQRARNDWNKIKKKYVW